MYNHHATPFQHGHPYSQQQGPVGGVNGAIGGPAGNNNAPPAPQQQQSITAKPPGQDALAWQATDFVNRAMNDNGRNVASLSRCLRDMTATLERTRIAYNQALLARDEKRNQLVKSEARLMEVRKVVGRYAGVKDPVVASDGFTYERQVIEDYLKECQTNETDAYSQQTREVLSPTLHSNSSLKKLVESLKAAKESEIPAAEDLKIIAPFQGGGASSSAGRNAAANKVGGANKINFLDEDSNKHARSAATSAAAPSSKPDAQSSNQAVTSAAGPWVAAASGSKPAGSSPMMGGATPLNTKDALHPCVRVYGHCNFRDGCQFAKYPYDACLNYIKGKCRFGTGCKELHVNLRDPKFKNASASNTEDMNGAPPTAASTAAGVADKLAVARKAAERK